ncbi:MAG: hypothetical protein ACXAC7_19275 [Candidatus Hodarchaeales archaeon]
MIHLVGLVFKGGLGIPIYLNKDYFEGQPIDLIWGLTSAMQTFAHTILGDKARGTSEMKSGNIRVVMYDPFCDLDEKNVPEQVDHYVLMALQDLYDNLEVTRDKLHEIHKNLVNLGLNKPDASISFQTSLHKSPEVKETISNIAERTQKLPDELLNLVRERIQKFISSNESKDYIPLVVSIADIDGGLLIRVSTKHLYEDPAFTELILSNLVAENPSDAKTIWIERQGPLWVSDNLLEAFVMEHIGENTDFRLLARVCFSQDKRDDVRDGIRRFSKQLESTMKIDDILMT